MTNATRDYGAPTRDATTPPYLPSTLAIPGSQYTEHVINRGRYSERSTARGRTLESINAAARLRRDYITLRRAAHVAVALDGRWTREAFSDMRNAHRCLADALRAVEIAAWYRLRGPAKLPL